MENNFKYKRILYDFKFNNKLNLTKIFIFETVSLFNLSETIWIGSFLKFTYQIKTQWRK